jgi:DNA-directed RNA polymerase alpha subunit
MLTELETHILMARLGGVTDSRLSQELGVTRQRINQRRDRIKRKVMSMLLHYRNSEIAIARWKQQVKSLQQEVEALRSNVPPLTALSTQSTPHPLESMSIEELNLSCRAYNCLKNARVEVVSEILNLTWSQLKRFSNMGVRSIEEVAECLDSLGLVHNIRKPQRGRM